MAAFLLLCSAVARLHMLKCKPVPPHAHPSRHPPTPTASTPARLFPRSHIQLAVRNDEELSKLLRDVTIAEGGVLPNIHTTLLPKKKIKKGGEEEE